MARQYARQMIRSVLDAFGDDSVPLPSATKVDTALAIAQLQVEATCAVAQSIVELSGELDGIRDMIGNLR